MTRCSRQSPSREIVEQLPIGEAGQRVVQRLMSEPCRRRVPIRDVADRERGAIDRRIVTAVVPDTFGETPRTIVALPAELDRRGRPRSGQQARQLLRDAVGIIRLDPSPPSGSPAKTERIRNLFIGTVRELHGPVAGEQHDDVSRHPSQRADLPDSFRQRPFHRSLVVDVSAGAVDANHLAGPINHGLRPTADPPLLTIGTNNDALVHARGRVPFDHRVQGCPDPGPIIGTDARHHSVGGGNERLRRLSQDPVQLIRPRHLTGRELP